MIKEVNTHTIEMNDDLVIPNIMYTMEDSDIVIDNSLEDITLVVERYMENDSWYKTTYISEEGFDHIKEIIDYNGLLTKDVPYEVLIDNTYNNE